MRPRDPYVPLGVTGGRAENIHRWPRREPASQREMLSGLMGWALHLAIKDRAKADGKAVYKLVSEMDLGSSTYDRLRNCKPVSQSTGLKIVTFLGTSLRQVWTKYQQEKK
jgi:hypothetical protein